ncbi:MAG TPA: hypothetical protein VJ352_06600 [Geodermatophilus sp.]|nr:hypothetical protein [Geodermatophilus sp.]
MSISLDGFVAGPDQSRDDPIGVNGAQVHAWQLQADELAADVIDELVLDISPVLLGRGERLVDGVDDPGFEPVEVIHSPHATRVRHLIGR